MKHNRETDYASLVIPRMQRSSRMLNLLKLNQEAKKTSQAIARKIEYIVIHYSAGITSRPGSAVFVADYFRDTEIKASADFIVDDAIAVQFNPDLQNRYTWHCGRSKKEESRSGILSPCTNQNSIGIEICSENRKHQITYPGDEAYSFTEAVLKNAAVLVGSLMEAYDIDISHVVRHYDVTGKECPGVRGWFGPADESAEWLKFKGRVVIERDRLMEADRL